MYPNKPTVIIKGFFKAIRILSMSLIIFQAMKHGIIFAAAGMTVIVFLLCALMLLAFADIYRCVIITKKSR
jgi:hypothetical protein